MDIFVRRRAAERHRVGEVERLDVLLVNLVEWREALTIVGAMVHQPVLRFLVGVDEALKCHLCGECGRTAQHGRGKHEIGQFQTSRGHRFSPLILEAFLRLRIITAIDCENISPIASHATGEDQSLRWRTRGRPLPLFPNDRFLLMLMTLSGLVSVGYAKDHAIIHHPCFSCS